MDNYTNVTRCEFYTFVSRSALIGATKTKKRYSFMAAVHGGTRSCDILGLLSEVRKTPFRSLKGCVYKVERASKAVNTYSYCRHQSTKPTPGSRPIQYAMPIVQRTPFTRGSFRQTALGVKKKTWRQTPCNSLDVFLGQRYAVADTIFGLI